jgi:nicotinamide-nucleotide amidase
VERNNDEKIRFCEEYWLFDIDLLTARDRFNTAIKPSRFVDLTLTDQEGEVRVTLESSDQKALRRLQAKFKAAFSPWLIGNINQTLEADFFELLSKHHWTVSTAESVTGGLIASRILDQAGASAILKEGYIVYSLDRKIKILGVNEAILNTYGVVSLETAQEMADRLAQKTGADIAIASTGIAGPSGGTAEIPVGTVCFGFVIGEYRKALRKQFNGSRNGIRKQAAAFAIGYVIKQLQEARSI